MPPETETTHITCHVHTDGPIPGPHSLLTVTSAAHAVDGDLIGEFTVNVRELPGATLHPVARQLWRLRADDWLSTRRASHPPTVAMTAYTRWIDALPGEKVFVTDTDEPDYLFVFWYLHRFIGRWPFTRVSTDRDLRDLLDPTHLCSLTGCRSLIRAC